MTYVVRLDFFWFFDICLKDKGGIREDGARFCYLGDPVTFDRVGQFKIFWTHYDP